MSKRANSQPGYKDGSIQDLLHLAEAYLSLILNVVSVLLLFLTILTYALFPELRNLPGCNLMCLAISTFMSQVKLFLYRD